ncbi:MAG: transporter [Bacteroidales bacterium]|nr:transporter [Bacteroidales bacterium]MCF8455716.1 transporter [Bacteroidales bacterium]
MKTIVLAVAILFISGLSFSQSPLPLGKAQLNLGVGFSDWGIPFYIGFDYSVHKDITLGAEFSYRGYRENWDNHKYNHTIMGFSGNGNYHFNSVLKIPQNWDFYAGLNVGFYTWSSPDDYHGDHSSGLDLGGQIGGRYYFSNRAGINLEFGGGNAFSGGKIGLTFKL